MKLTDDNYDINQFPLSRLAKLLLILRVSAYGSMALRTSFKDIAKLWLQHQFGDKVDRLKHRLQRLKNLR
ncbi:MAG: hypothetical protein ACRBHB_22065 [Arenicella sp.]